MGDLSSQIDRGNLVVIGNLFVRLYGQRYFVRLPLLQHAWTDEINDDNVGLGVVLPRVPHDPFHPAHRLPVSMPRISVIVDRKFHKEQIDGALIEHVVLQTKCAGRRTG